MRVFAAAGATAAVCVVAIGGAMLAARALVPAEYARDGSGPAIAADRRSASPKDNAEDRGAKNIASQDVSLPAALAFLPAVAPTTERKADRLPFRSPADAFAALGAPAGAPPAVLAKPARGGVPLPTARPPRVETRMSADPKVAALPAEPVPIPMARPKATDRLAGDAPAPAAPAAPAPLAPALLALAPDRATAVYVIASGAFALPDGTLLQGGSGTVATHNNPALQANRNGPIPEGIWNAGRSQSMISTFANGTQHRETGIFLEAASGTETYGRDRAINRFGQREAFAIHPDNSRGKLTNIGCISFLAADAAKVFAARDAGAFDKILVIGTAPGAAVAERGRLTRSASAAP